MRARQTDQAGPRRARLDRNESAGERPHPALRDGQQPRPGHRALPGGRPGRGRPAEGDVQDAEAGAQAPRGLDDDRSLRGNVIAGRRHQRLPGDPGQPGRARRPCRRGRHAQRARPSRRGRGKGPGKPGQGPRGGEEGQRVRGGGALFSTSSRTTCWQSRDPKTWART